METIYLNREETASLPPSVATLGFFDGVHRGHQALIAQVISLAQATGLASMVVTFDRHPRQVLHQNYQPELLTTLDMKLQRLAETGVDRVVVVHFDTLLASLSAHDFMQNILLEQLCVKKLIIGYDNRFGHNRAEGFDDYVGYGQQLGIEVIHGEAFSLDDVQVSSSVVRAFLKEGEIAMANRCLGYEYTLGGRIVDGVKQGRKMGYPTANLDTKDFGQLIPANGVYAVRVGLKGYDKLLPAMTDVGTRPTFGDNQLTIETFIFNFHEDIYGQPMHLSFVRRVRDDLKFDIVNQLVTQLKEDERMIEKIFKKDNNE